MPARSLSGLRRDAASCRACPLWEDATQTVFGRPRVLVCLGATAAQSLLSRDFRVTQHRGEWLESAGRPVGERRDTEMKSFVEDLRLAASVL